jgi:hypothetical protein
MSRRIMPASRPGAMPGFAKSAAVANWTFARAQVGAAGKARKMNMIAILAPPGV